MSIDWRKQGLSFLFFLTAWSLVAAEPGSGPPPTTGTRPPFFGGRLVPPTPAEQYQDALRFLNEDPVKEGGLKMAAFIFEHLSRQRDTQSVALAKAGLEKIQSMRLGLELVSALEGKNEGAVRELIKKGASLEMRTARGYTPLILACETNNFRMVEALVAAGARVTNGSSSQVGSTPLHFAAMHNDTNLLAYLLEHGVPVDIRSRRGDTPLYMAVNRGCFRSAEFLLVRGADPNLFSFHNDQGNECSPLMAVSGTNSNVELIDLLLEHGAKLEARNKFGRTALMSAATLDAAPVVKHLIAKGADVNATGPAGHTALILAAYNGRLETVKLLLDAGADPLAMARDSEDPNQESGHYDAVDLALEQDHADVANVIAQAQERRLNRPRPFIVHPGALKRRESLWL